MVCATAPDTYHESCAYISSVTGRPYFGSPTNTGSEPPIFRIQPGGMQPPPGIGVGVDDAKSAPCLKADGTLCGDTGGDASQALAFGFPRDTFWPKSAAAFVGLGILLTLLSAQLVSPTRRLHLPRLRRRQPTEQTPEAAT